MLNLSKPNWNELRARVLEWTSQSGTYTPVWTAATTNPTIGNGTLIGRYVVRGRLCKVTMLLVFGSTTNGGSGNWSLSLPFEAANTGVHWLLSGWARDLGTNSYPRFAQVAAGGSTSISVFIAMDSPNNSTALSATAPFTWASGDFLSIDGEYEIK